MLRTRKALVLAGAAVALVGTGTATAATVAAPGGPAPRPVAAPDHPARPLVAVPALGGARIAAAGGAVPPAVASRAPASRTAVTLPAVSHPAVSHPASLTWYRVQAAINQETNPAAARHGRLPAADQLIPVRTSGPQEWMSIDSGQAANAATIVRQAIHQRMGVRSAVIAVATAMQESMLKNIDYGTGTALGLFQQQPNDGWGTPKQVTNPVYASRAFLTALQRHQASDPTWAKEPLWANAQAVQNSAFPTAYAKWETQAASLVRHIAMREAAANLIAVNPH
jgi:hypothetical protein